jgi:hypothetical protein
MLSDSIEQIWKLSNHSVKGLLFKDKTQAYRFLKSCKLNIFEGKVRLPYNDYKIFIEC